MEACPRHLERMKALDKQIGGLTDEEGSMKVMGFEKCTAMDEYLNNKPCETEDVCQKTYAEVMNVVLVSGEKRSPGGNLSLFLSLIQPFLTNITVTKKERKKA